MDGVIAEGENLTRTFFRKGRESARNFDAVADANVTLSAGELIALKGRSGSGKSTLLNMMAGLLAPTSGTVRVDGTDLYSLADDELSRLRNGKIGVVPQGQSALHALSAIENVKLPLLMYGTDEHEADKRAMELLERLGIVDLADAFPRELSGGELRRVAIARALMCKPRLVLADEPTGDLDDETTACVLDLLRDAADSGAAVLVVTHEQAVETYADAVMRMEAGKIVS